MDSGGFPFEQSFELEVGLFFVEKDDLHIDIITQRMKKVGQKRLDSLVVDVSTNDNKLTAIRFVLARVPTKEILCIKVLPISLAKSIPSRHF